MTDKAALDVHPEGVKALAWNDGITLADGQTVWAAIAEGMEFTYSIWGGGEGDDGRFFCAKVLPQHFASLDEAKEAVQFNYDERIRSAIITTYPKCPLCGDVERCDACAEVNDTPDGRLYDDSAPMADGEVEMTAAEDVLGWLLIEKIGVPDDRNYTPKEAQETIANALDHLRQYEAAALSHPEPVAQEAVALRPSYARIIEIVNECRERVKSTGESDRMMSRWISEAIDAEVFAQGEGYLEHRLRTWHTEGPLKRSFDAQQLCIEAANTISALRARVAELEARATPQAGASEAEPVAWMRDYPDMTCLTTTKPEPPEPGWRDIWMPLYATPPDSDVVRAALSQLEEGLRNNRLCLSDVQQIVTATLSNQGSSSNGK